ncbi:MAG: GAF domain-containing sensor histidine kinase [Calothrix sp. MO_167.B42]|nr:GAF domain-containing sensor histidine kinase [Calothrix sp. MO_167.B42]
MVEPDNKMLNIKKEWSSPDLREERRLKALSELNLRQPETIPVFEEATQTAAHFLSAPISILGFIDQEFHWFKSAVGLSRLGLMNKLAQTRQLLRQESFCSQVVENAQILTINDTSKNTYKELTDNKLIKDYGIRAYLGAPLIDAAGNCLGTIAVMDLITRQFTRQDEEFLQIIARWSMSEFERNRLLQASPPVPAPSARVNRVSREDIWQVEAKNEETPAIILSPSIIPENLNSTNQLKLELLGQLTHELRTPLTSVLGMASVLGREIYGPLTTKQREYLEIIQHSGRYLLSLVNEITELGAMADSNSMKLNTVPVDIEMLCQQAINTLEEVAHRREQEIRLSIEPGRSRIYLLDRDKVRQILYHLIFSVIQTSATGSLVRIHISYKEDNLNITTWVSHPWLGDGITEVDPFFNLKNAPQLEFNNLISNSTSQSETSAELGSQSMGKNHYQHMNGNNISQDDEEGEKVGPRLSRESLGLLLSKHLTELHGGYIFTQGSQDSGYRYVLSLPMQQETTSEIVDEV